MNSDSVYDALPSFLASVGTRRGTHALDFNALRRFHDASHSFILRADRAHRLGLLASLSTSNSHALSV